MSEIEQSPAEVGLMLLILAPLRDAVTLRFDSLTLNFCVRPRSGVREQLRPDPNFLL